MNLINYDLKNNIAFDEKGKVVKMVENDYHASLTPVLLYGCDVEEKICEGEALTNKYCDGVLIGVSTLKCFDDTLREAAYFSMFTPDNCHKIQFNIHYHFLFDNINENSKTVFKMYIWRKATDESPGSWEEIAKFDMKIDCQIDRRITYAFSNEIWEIPSDFERENTFALCREAEEDQDNVIGDVYVSRLMFQQQ